MSNSLPHIGINNKLAEEGKRIIRAKIQKRRVDFRLASTYVIAAQSKLA
ncbi:MAG: hypothetical protein N3E52_02400 [Candidatus Bathyarchaeota archaeon]|nr:hypothetical protein [Candidatus Bathyarchaeota archaeon]